MKSCEEVTHHAETEDRGPDRTAPFIRHRQHSADRRRRQVGKTFIVRHVGKKLFPHFIEINMLEDSVGSKLFERATTVEDFYLRVSMAAGDKMGKAEDTLIFIDEIQAYPHLLTLLKFLRDDGRFTYIASGSLLGVTLSETTSIPMGSIRKVRMFPLDFEEFLYANGMNGFVISALRKKFEARESLDEAMHGKMMDLFRRYLLVGGLPAAVNAYLETKNIQAVREIQREIQREIHEYYAAEASKYDAVRKLKIRRIYDLIPSNLERKKKRVVAQQIEGKSGKDHTVHSALNAFAKNEDYHVKKAVVLSNNREITVKGKIVYLPIYDVMFFGTAESADEPRLLNVE